MGRSADHRAEAAAHAASLGGVFQASCPRSEQRAVETQKRATLSAKSERSSPGGGFAKEMTVEQGFEDRMEFPEVEG